MPLQRLFAAACLLFALAGCSPSGDEGKPSVSQAATPVGAPVAGASTAIAPAPVVTAPAKAAAQALLVANEDAAIKLISEAIQKHRLTSLPIDCLTFMPEEEGATTYSVEVHENHTPPCKGDPDTSPRLFSFKVDRSNGQLSTDATDPADGEYQPIQ
ncbi:hypothetical protein [Dyella silvatica]|uniref:hypothetical protein n=1 Tax=Dyella silvatica TaxID=2992128 RepID=UPI00225A698B|nr:hypothetical protein [Dyella silvatica]